MSRSGTGSKAHHGAASVPASRADTAIRAAAGGTVAGLAGIAGAISDSHMRELAVAHGETGWQGHAFPLSVDGIEIVASLVLLIDRVSANGWRGPGWRAYRAHARHTKAIRDWIARAVASHGCPVDPDIAALAVSELFTNAILHGPPDSRVLVGYCLWGGGARIVVCDGGGTTIPQLRDPADGEEGGRGLYVVEALSAQWDSFHADGTQIVWCDLGQPLAATHSDAWARLAALLAMVRPPPPGTQVFARHDGRASPGASPDHGLVTLSPASGASR